MGKSKVLAEMEATITGVELGGDEAVAKIQVGEKPKTIEERLAALDKVTESLNKKLETTHSLVKLGSKVGIKIPSIPMNIPKFDWETIQCGGIPRGRVIEIFGPESCGKTTICLYLTGQEQKTGELAAFVDAEHALDPTWAMKCGVDVDNLYVSQPDSGEDALETVAALVRSRAVSIIVVDSVAALVPKAELDGDFGASHMGLQARMMSQAMRKLSGLCAVTGVTVLFINQIREKIGVTWGSNETTPGGRALKFYASVRIDVRKIGVIKDGDEIIGHTTRLKLVKNKVGPPFRECEIDLMYSGGLNIWKSWLEYGVEQGVITQKGAWYSLGDDRLGQGAIPVALSLKNDPKLFLDIQKKILDRESSAC